MQQFFSAIARKLAYVLAAGIMLLACFVVVAQLLTPYFDKHLPDIESMASSYLKKPVTISNVRLSWDQYQPVIRLHNVIIHDEKNNKPIIGIEKISIFFSLIDSIRHWKLSPGGILISGTNLNVYQNAAGEISVQGFPPIGGAQPFQEETKFRDIMGWLLQQSRIILHDINVSYTNHANIKRNVTLYNLSMQNSGFNHVVVGKAVLHQDIPTEVMLAINLEGPAEAYDQLKGNIYLYVSGLSLSQWMKGATWQNWRLDQGIGSAKIWARWEQGSVQRIQSIFNLYNLQLFSLTDKSLHRVNRLSGNIGWKKTGNQHVIAADDVLVNLPDHLWPATSFSITAIQEADGTFSPKTIKVGYLDISDAESFIFASPGYMPEAVKKQLIETKFDGELDHASIIFNGANGDWQQTVINAEFNHISIEPWQQYPGISNLSGIVDWDAGKGELILNSQELEFHHEKIFTNKIMLNQVIGKIDVNYSNDMWQLSTNQLQIQNNDLNAKVTGSLIFPVNGEVESDLTANFNVTHIGYVARYLPLNIFSKKLGGWLRSAFLDGELVSGVGQLKGKFKDFPFAQGNGIFNVSGTVKNVDLAYAPTWPKLTQLGGKILFVGNQIKIDLDHGRLMDIPIASAHAEIPYLGDAKPNILYVTSNNISSDMSAAMKFIHASPLEKNIGRMFRGMAIAGPLSLNLKLTVPLADPDKIEVQGDLSLDKIDMNLIPWDLRINKVSGEVHFTEDSTTSAPLTGVLFNKPITFQLETVGQKKASVVRANVTNHMDVSDLESWFKMPLSKVATGGADVKSVIDLAFDAPINIQLISNLKGIAFNLPDQYSKIADEERPFKATITVEEGKPLLAKLAYNNVLSSALVFDRKNSEFHLTGADLRLGGGEPEWPQSDGIYLTGSINSLNWDKIKSYLAQSQTNNNSLKEYTLKEVNVLIGQLDVFGQHLTSAQVTVIPSPKTYLIKLYSPQVVGSIQVPTEFSSSQTINANFELLTLQASVDKQDLPIDFKTLPAISLSAKNVSYNNMLLGQVTLKTRSIKNGQAVDMLHIVSRNIDLNATGNWLAAGKGYKSAMKGAMDSEHVSDLLNQLGMDAHNFISNKGHVNFNLNWNDAFYSPDVATLNGKFSLDLGAGRIVDVGATSGAKMDLGKILSIFSLQSIPRRLSLDFSDIFQKGYSFDSLRGDYSIDDGNIFTNNMRIEGPVAKITINGRIGLSKKDVDFVLNVTPYVTSSIPLAAGLLTANPLVGLGALAVNTVIGSQVVTYSYDVNGSWSNPNWQQVGSSPRH